jgi:transglutaminase-like putative cysteine protease
MTALALPRGRELSGDTQRLLWTAAIVAGASLPHWPTLAAWTLALLGAAVAWRLAVAVYAWPMAPRFVRLPLSFLAFCAVLFQYRTLNGAEAGTALLVVMVALKFLESSNQRDQLVLILISYFMMFASVLTERGPLTAVYLVVLVWVTTVALLQLGRRGPLLPVRATTLLAGRLLLYSVPVMAVLFVLFPRLPGPLWALPGSTSSGATGLSDTMSPGDITNLGLSDEIAFRAEFMSRAPRAGALYWRGPTLTHFNGRTWSMQQGARRGERVADTIEYRGEPTRYRVMLEPNGRNWAFALDMPQSWSRDRGLRMASDYQLSTFFGGQRARVLDYEVTSYIDYSAREPLTPGEIATFTSLPEGSSPRTRALAATWITDDPSPSTVIERAMGYLRSQPFQYTLTPPALGAEPVDEFLFETREGFCEHYASALTVLLRAAGLPARVVMGYQGGELNSIGRYYMIRQSDAHAWTEVWLKDEGWVRVDGVAAVAPDRVAIGSGRWSGSGRTAVDRVLNLGWLRRTALLWDAVNTRWHAWVVGYGPELQRALLDSFGIRNLERTERWTLLLCLAVIATIGVLLALRLYAGWRERRRQPIDPAARVFATFARQLARYDVAPRAPGEPPAAYAARAAKTLPPAAAEIGAILAAYLRARYEPDPELAALAELRQRVSAFRPRRA